MTDTKTDVLVVGAGPVGLTMVSEMARYGLSVLTIDKNTERTDKVCDWVKQGSRLRINLTAPFSGREAFRELARF